MGPRAVIPGTQNRPPTHPDCDLLKGGNVRFMVEYPLQWSITRVVRSRNEIYDRSTRYIHVRRQAPQRLGEGYFLAGPQLVSVHRHNPFGTCTPSRMRETVHLRRLNEREHGVRHDGDRKLSGQTIQNRPCPICREVVCDQQSVDPFTKAVPDLRLNYILFVLHKHDSPHRICGP
jgi:hypothetical protein